MTGDFGTIDSNLAAGALTLNTADQANLRTAGKWARFLGILGLISLGLILLVLIFGGTAFFAAMSSGLGDDGAAAAGVGALGILFYAVFILFAAYLYWQLYQFGAKAMKAVDSGDRQLLSESFVAQSKLYKIMGILAAVYLAFMLLGVVSMLIGGAAALL